MCWALKNSRATESRRFLWKDPERRWEGRRRRTWEQLPPTAHTFTCDFSHWEMSAVAKPPRHCTLLGQPRQIPILDLCYWPRRSVVCAICPGLPSTGERQALPAVGEAWAGALGGKSQARTSVQGMQMAGVPLGHSNLPRAACPMASIFNLHRMKTLEPKSFLTGNSSQNWYLKECLM